MTPSGDPSEHGGDPQPPKPEEHGGDPKPPVDPSHQEGDTGPKPSSAA
nr:MAG TPA: hypothetical protein [Caudoviricetes sp.]